MRQAGQPGDRRAQELDPVGKAGLDARPFLEAVGSMPGLWPGSGRGLPPARRRTGGWELGGPGRSRPW